MPAPPVVAKGAGKRNDAGASQNHNWPDPESTGDGVVDVEPVQLVCGQPCFGVPVATFRGDEV